MTQETNQECPCAKCATPLMKWEIVNGIQFRRLRHWINPGAYEGLVTLGPYCWPCWQEITQGVGKDKVL